MNECPICGASANVAEKESGQRVLCPRCGKFLLLVSHLHVLKHERPSGWATASHAIRQMQPSDNTIPSITGVGSPGTELEFAL